MRDEFRDPRIHPRAGDVVDVDFGDGDIERRKVIKIEHHANAAMVHFHVNGDEAHARSIRMTAWREFADDSAIIDRGLG